jgi:hypothetical protein
VPLKGRRELGRSNDSKEVPVAPERTLSDAAKRALAEAEERRRQAQELSKDQPPKEVGGRAGPEPTRFGDWEKKGIASDF